MSAVNLEVLISNANGDDAFVREIISMSVEQAETQISLLKNFCVDGVSEDWQHNAHALKGTAATLGAGDMRRLCEIAQKEMLDTSAAVRQQQLAAIENCYADVKKSLADLGYI